MGYGLWVMGYGLWIMGVGLWVMGYGCWVMGVGCWVLGVGLMIRFLDRFLNSSTPQLLKILSPGTSDVKMPFTANVAIRIVTVEDPVEFGIAGADDFLTEPVNPKRLVARINRILNRQAAEAIKTDGLMDGENGFDKRGS